MVPKILKLFIGLYMLLNLGCGVKGKPTPPDVTPVIGDGQVQYKKPKPTTAATGPVKKVSNPENDDEDSETKDQ